MNPKNMNPAALKHLSYLVVLNKDEFETAVCNLVSANEAYVGTLEKIKESGAKNIAMALRDFSAGSLVHYIHEDAVESVELEVYSVGEFAESFPNYFFE